MLRCLELILLSFRLPFSKGMVAVPCTTIHLNYRKTAQHENPSYYCNSALSEATLCGEKSSSPENAPCKGEFELELLLTNAYNHKILKFKRIVCYNMTRTKQSRRVSIPKSDLDSLEATIETLENEYVMDQLERSDQDILNSRVRDVREFLKEL